jgi:ABC-2 type transport system permease protein
MAADSTTPRRLLRLWSLYGRMDLLWVARAPRSAVAWYVSDLIVGGAVVASTFLLAERFDGIGAWSREQVLFLLGYALFVRGLVELLFGANVGFISRRIGRGQIDHVLLQPQPVWMSLATEGFAPAAGSGLVIAGGWLLVHATGQVVTPTPGWLGLLAVNACASLAVVMAYSYVWGCLAFWAPRSAEEINSSTMRLIDELRSFPLDGVGAGLMGGLLSVVPVGFVAWYPSRALLGLAPGPIHAWVTPLFAVCALTVAYAIFHRGMKRYGQTGSTRYLSLGHRR